MSEDPKHENLGQAVMARLKQLRLRTYGQRGLGEFARELGVSPATYRRYEKLKAAPVELLAKAAKLTGAQLAWLITGRKTDGSPQQDIPADRQALLERIERLAQRNPATLRAIQKFMDLLKQQTTDTVSLIQINVPSDAQVAEFLDCPAVRKRYPDAFALRIDGASMAPQLILGDLVIVSPSQPALQGKPAVVQLRDQIGVTCKLYRCQANKVHLIPTNEQYEPQNFELSEFLWALRVLFRIRVNPQPTR